MPQKLASDARHALNAVCPYYTMFPLEYPLGILKKRGNAVHRVLDPFCGRGTTLYAARARHIAASGIDVSPVAVAIARAKVARTTPDEAIALAETILSNDEPIDVPTGAFWELAYAPTVLRAVCRLRTALLENSSEAAALLRALCLGALHGPLSKDVENAGYFSNQMPRTFASKPDYSVRYWREHRLRPRAVSPLGVLRKRIERLKEKVLPFSGSSTDVVQGDAGVAESYRTLSGGFDTIITSPPYYGMNVYVQDQWLRSWFAGAAADIDYGTTEQVSHHSVGEFTESLAAVWDQVGVAAARGLHLYARFGSIPSRRSEPTVILKDSFARSKHAWEIISVRNASTAAAGRRQAHHMNISSAPKQEYDFHVCLAA